MKRALPIFVAVAVLLTTLYFLRRKSQDSASAPTDGRAAANQASAPSAPEIRVPTALNNGSETAPSAVPLTTSDRNLSSSVITSRELPRGGMAEARRQGLALKKKRERALSPDGKFDRFPTVAGTTGRWAMVTGLWALPEASASASTPALHRELGHLFVKIEANGSVPDAALPAVYDPQRGSFGILSGGVLIALKSQKDASAIAREYQIRLVQPYEDIGIVSFKSASRDGEELARLISSLTADARVREAKLEVFDRLYEPQ